jgi:ATP-dependent DNA helicase DinG
VSVERLAPAVRELVRAEIAAARGREVSFVARLDPDGLIVDARVVARGTVDAVLALPGIAVRGELLLHNHPSGVLEPSGADLSVAARLHDGGVGFAIVDNAVTDCYVVVECPRPRATTRIDPIDVAALLSPSGPVARALGSFEDRPSQRDMAAYVADLYNEGGVGMLEAGTGVGKSFAYLVPALVWARENGERTVVSTNTINLQEQLVGKDLPILARALGTGEHSPTFALLKGWRNYVCLARLEQAREQGDSLFEDERSWTVSRRGPRDRATGRSPICRTSRAATCGTRWQRSRISAPGSSAPISTAASCSRRGGARRRRTSSS